MKNRNTKKSKTNYGKRNGHIIYNVYIQHGLEQKPTLGKE